MKQFLLAAVLVASVGLPAPVPAQEGPAQGGNAEDGKAEVERGFDLLREATRLILRGLMREMEPRLRELEEILDQLDAYEAPEILPNGDILIRRKRPPAEAAPTEPSPDRSAPGAPPQAPRGVPDDAPGAPGRPADGDGDEIET